MYALIWLDGFMPRVDLLPILRSRNRSVSESLMRFSPGGGELFRPDERQSAGLQAN